MLRPLTGLNDSKEESRVLPFAQISGRFALWEYRTSVNTGNDHFTPLFLVLLLHSTFTRCATPWVYLWTLSALGMSLMVCNLGFHIYKIGATTTPTFEDETRRCAELNDWRMTRMSLMMVIIVTILIKWRQKQKGSNEWTRWEMVDAEENQVMSRKTHRLFCECLCRKIPGTAGQFLAMFAPRRTL